MYKLVYKNKDWKGSFWEPDEEWYFWDESLKSKGEYGLTLEEAQRKAESYMDNPMVWGLRIQDEESGEVIKVYIDKEKANTRE